MKYDEIKISAKMNNIRIMESLDVGDKSLKEIAGATGIAYANVCYSVPVLKKIGIIRDIGAINILTNKGRNVLKGFREISENL